MKNISKLKLITTVLSATVLILTLAGCTGMAGGKSQEKNQQAVEKSYTVSGKILFDGTTGARAATTSFALPDSYDYVIKAEKFVKQLTDGIDVWDEDNPVMGTVTAEAGTLSYSIKLYKTGKWKIVFGIVETDNPGTVIAILKEKIINIGDDYKLYDETDKPLDNVNLEIKPSYSGIKKDDNDEVYYETSNVKLTVSKDQFEEGSDDNIEKVIWSWQCMNMINDSQSNTMTQDEFDWIEVVNNWIYSQDPVEKYFENDETTVIFEFDDVPACSFKVALSFVTAGGKYLQIYQDVNVFKNFVTDTWYGQDDYFEQNENGQYNLVVTPDLLKNAGERFVLYNYDNQDFNYFTTNDLALVNKDIQSSIYHEVLNATDFCFGSAGCVYFLYSIPEQELGKWQISSNTYVFTEPFSVTSTMPVPSLIAYDQGFKKLYALNYNNNIITIYEVNDLKDSTKFNTYQFTIKATDDFYGFDLKDFTVFSDVVYFAFEKDFKPNDAISSWYTDIALVSTDLSNYIPGGEPIINNLQTKDSTYPVTKKYNYHVNITDMLYQDHKLYLLINDESSPDYNLIYSRGEVYMYSLIDGSEKSSGMAASSINTIKTGFTSSATSDAIFYISREDEHDLSTGIPAVHEFKNAGIQLFAPYNELHTRLSGPQKFVAIKPKKLVITDAGIALYTDDDGVTKYKEVNRVVYVDIETLSLSGSVDVDLQLLKAYYEPKISILGNLEDSISCFKWYSSGTEAYFYSDTATGNIYAHLIKGN